MNKRAIFAVSVAMGFIAFGLVTALFIAPALDTPDAFILLEALVALHAYRFIGLAFLVPGVVGEGLAPEFARPAAYGDLIAAVLAVVAVLLLHGHVAGAAIALWAFNLWGTGDLLNAMFQGVRRLDAHPKGPGLLGAAFFIPTVIVPALLITHALIFWLLLRGHPPV